MLDNAVLLLVVSLLMSLITGSRRWLRLFAMYVGLCGLTFAAIILGLGASASLLPVHRLIFVLSLPLSALLLGGALLWRLLQGCDALFYGKRSPANDAQGNRRDSEVGA